jgi:PAS domain S-box-containing protein
VEGTKDYAIFLLDQHGNIASWNPGAERIKQYRAEEIIGQHFSRFYPAEDVQSGKPSFELQVAAAEGRYEEEGWRVRKDGSRFWANVIFTPLFDTDGQLRGYGKVTRDLSERRNMGRALSTSFLPHRRCGRAVSPRAILWSGGDYRRSSSARQGVSEKLVNRARQ